MPTQTAVKQTIAKNKLSTTELSALYDRVYDIADRLFKKHNPCNVQIIDGGIGCNSRKTNIKYGLCCASCKHLSDKGCTVKCLPCKLFVCSRLIYSYDKNGKEIRNEKERGFVDRLYRLRKIAAKSGIYTHAYFHTKDEVLDISKQRR